MPDITMCTNKECKLNKKCKRFLILPDNVVQSFQKFEPKKNKLGITTCDFFIRMPKFLKQ
jgi:hypothetical protein